MEKLLQEIAACKICEKMLPLDPRPVVSASKESKIVIVGQAPGIAVHNSGIPWDDPSGKNLRNWLGVTAAQFYDPKRFALIPMGFCYPGKGKSGDLPPRKECEPQWHQPLFEAMKEVKLVLLIGQYAQANYLGDKACSTLTETVRNYKQYLPNYFVLPHPSPRNNIWMKKNEWFKFEVLPALKEVVSAVLT